VPDSDKTHHHKRAGEKNGSSIEWYSSRVWLNTRRKLSQETTHRIALHRAGTMNEEIPTDTVECNSFSVNMTMPKKDPRSHPTYAKSLPRGTAQQSGEDPPVDAETPSLPIEQKVKKLTETQQVKQKDGKNKNHLGIVTSALTCPLRYAINASRWAREEYLKVELVWRIEVENSSGRWAKIGKWKRCEIDVEIDREFGERRALLLCDV
jgi:hypothetical protein